MINNPRKTPNPRVVYNDGGLSPDGNNDFVAGCVAVSMGQLMAYHEWPESCSLPGDMVVDDTVIPIVYPYGPILSELMGNMIYLYRYIFLNNCL
jgi:hypothetical protein